MANRGRVRELARLAYTELRRGNSRVRIQVAAEPSAAEPPIFVLSPYRSGTTLLRYALDSHPRLACPPESDFIQHVVSLVEDVSALEGLNSMGFDRSHVLARAGVFCDYFFTNYAASSGKSRWVDKSPSYVPISDNLKEIFPSAHFLILHRHPLDQIQSFTKAGTVVHPVLQGFRHSGSEDPRILGARYWAAMTRVLIEVSKWDRSLTIKYETLCAQPETTLRSILEFVGEPWDSRVLEFYNYPHDLGKESVRIRGTRGFDARSGTYLSWPSALIEECWGIVRGPAMHVGYSAKPVKSAEPT